MTLFCPKCGKPFGADDVNVRTDVAHCRTCGQDFSYAALTNIRLFEDDLHKGNFSPQFKVDCQETVTGVDLKLSYARSRTAGTVSFVMATLLLLCGCGFFAYILFAKNVAANVSSGLIAPGLLCVLFSIFLLIIGTAQRRRLEIEMSGGKGRVWTYALFRGKGRPFVYDAKSDFVFQGDADVLGRPVVVKIRLTREGKDVWSIRYALPAEDGVFLSGLLGYVLAAREFDDLKPEPDRPETPEEAAARRVEEANAVSAAKWAKWRWLKVVAIMAAVIGLRIGLEHMDRRKSSVKEHQVRLLRAFAEGGDYWAVAREMPVRAPKSYQERMYKDLANFDAVTFLYRDFQATESWNREKLDDFVSRCAAVTNRLGTKKATAAHDIALGRCTALIECCQRAKAALENGADTNAQLKIKVDFKAKVEACTGKERNP